MLGSSTGVQWLGLVPFLPGLVQSWIRELDPTSHVSQEKTNKKIPHVPETPLLDIYLKKTKALIWKDTQHPNVLVILLIIDEIQQQPKCPSTDK